MTNLSTFTCQSLLPTSFKNNSKRLPLSGALSFLVIATGTVVALSGLAGSLVFRFQNLQPIGHNSPIDASRQRVVTSNPVAPPAAAQLNSARRAHTATLLSDGNVLIVGGENSTGFVTAAELFASASGNFSVTGNLGTPRADHTATRLSDGRILIAGGRGVTGPLNSTEIFDPGTGVFTSGPNLNSARSGHTAISLSDGRILVIGGDRAGSVEIYVPLLHAFVSVSAKLTFPRTFHSAADLNNGNILIVGGAATDNSPLLSGEIFNVTSSTFSVAGNQTQDSHLKPLLRVLADGKVQIIGGSDHEAIELYDPATNSFGAHAHVFPIGDSHPDLLQEILDSPTRAALFRLGASSSLLDRTGHAVTELPGSNQALVTGGIDSSGSFLSSAATLNSSAARVTTDKLDYAPGTPVIVSGSGWQPNEIVTIMFHEDPHVDTENVHTFMVEADASGNFVCQQYAPEELDNGISFILAAKGSFSGWTAQTAFTDSDPAPQPIPYSQNFSGLPVSGAGSTTYPAGWQGWQLSTSGSSTSFRTSAATADLPLNAGSSASTVTGGVHNYNGKIGILATGSNDPSLALAINSTGHSNLTISFDIMTIRNPFDGGSNTRLNQVDLQYRVGTAGLFTSASGLTNGVYQNNTTTQTGAGVTTPQKLESKSFMLPAAVNNQAVVQLRWVQRDLSGGGARPGFAVDNVAIGSQPAITSANATTFIIGSAGTFTISTTGLPTPTISRSGALPGGVTFNNNGDGTATLSGTPDAGSAGSYPLTLMASNGVLPDATQNFILTVASPGSLEFSAANYNSTETNSGAHTTTVTVQRTGGSDGAVEVSYATSDGAATLADNDYLSSSGTLHWNDGDSTDKSFTVTVKGDTTYETDEIVNLTLSDPTGGAIVDGTNPATLTIGNDDSAPAISIDDVTHSENDAGTTSYDFTVSLSNASYQTVMVDYATANNTATAPSDYSAVPTETLIFLPGETAKQVTVNVNGDATFEAEEDFFVNLGNATNATVSDDHGLATIQNDDSQPTISIADQSQVEGNSGSSNFDFALTLSNPSDQTITVHYSTADGTGTQPGDYSSSSGTLTFVPGETAETVGISVNGDTTFENDETFIVSLDTPSNATILDGIGSAAIQNDDSQPTVQFVLASSSGSESAGPVNLLASLTNDSSETVTVNYAVNASTTATGGGVDYTLLGSGTLTFNAGETNSSVSFTVNDDTLDEFDETVVVDLSTPANATLGASATHAYVIEDNDDEPSVQFVAASSANPESSTPVNLAANLSSVSAKTVTVQYAVNGSSTATGGGTDYTLASGMLTFNPGETAKNVSFTVNDDNLDENDESVAVDLSAPGNAVLGTPTSHTHTIQDNDAAPFFSISDVTLAEGNSSLTDFIFTVTRTGPTALTTTVDYATANGTINPASGGLACDAGIDYQSGLGTLTFDPGDTALTVTIKICGDTSNENNEIFLVNLSGATNASISDNMGVGSITNDDGSSSYNFEGFFAPVDDPPVVNTVKAGSAVPVKWRLTSSVGVPLSDAGSFAGLFSYEVACGSSAGLEAPLETVAPGGSGLQYLGNGNWQINWKTQANYLRGSCRVLELRLNDGTSHYANFKFK